MLRKQHVYLLVAAVGVTLALGGSCLWCSARPTPVVTPPPAERAPPPVEPKASPPAQPPPPPTTPEPPPSPRPPARPAATTAPAPAASTPQCTRDLDCKGPRQADCTRASCRDGKCVYDYGACECRTAADCDDGDPCTRNHCFAATKKCIFIKEGCD